MATKEHLRLEERVKIQSLIDSRYCRSLARLAEEVGCNRSTIYREIKNNSYIKNGVIEIVQHDKDHIECGIRKHFPYVCNGCTKERCVKRKFFYDAYQADLYSKQDLHESRRHPMITTKSLKELDTKISDRVLSGQSLYHIKETDKTIKQCESTIRRYINNGYLTARTIDLPRTVRFKAKPEYDYKRKRVNVALLNGRMYSDFIAKMKDGNNHIVLQIDTVFGKKTDKTCILTVFETKSRFQWGYVIKQTCAQVNGCIRKMMKDLKNACGGKLFFDIILMDNGPEFEQVPLLEFDQDGVLNFQSYFCDPYRSGQKGGCERNHEFIRYVYRKGESISSLDQGKLDNLFSQINSLKRRSLQGKSSYEVFAELYGYIIAEIIGIVEINPKNTKFKK